VTRPWKEIRDKAMRQIEADPARKARFEELHRDARHMATLSQLRHAMELTQQQLAETAQLTQSSVSQIEQRGDLFVSTLRRYIEAMGGTLEVVAIFGDEKIPLQIGDGKVA
jgi:DNA-binding XRE family transcriptional regulator